MTATTVAIVRRRRRREALAATLPFLLGSGTWGIITGAAMVQAGLAVPEAVGMSLLVFSGTTQLVALPLIASDASLLLIVVTAFLTGLRFVVYSASVSRDLIRMPLRRRLLLGFLMTDTGLSIYQMRRSRGGPPQRIAFYLGCNIPVWAAWHLGSLAGIALASFIPTNSSLAYLGVLAILAIAVPMIASFPALGAAVISGAVAVIGWHWPYRLGMFSAIVAGVSAALLIEYWLETRRASVQPAVDGDVS